jgi:hypothetical protein
MTLAPAFVVPLRTTLWYDGDSDKIDFISVGCFSRSSTNDGGSNRMRAVVGKSGRRGKGKET